jgi:hypothetical protein
MLAMARHSGHEKARTKVYESVREKPHSGHCDRRSEAITVVMSLTPSKRRALYCCQDLNGVSGTGVSGGLSAAHAAILSTTS